MQSRPRNLSYSLVRGMKNSIMMSIAHHGAALSMAGQNRHWQAHGATDKVLQGKKRPKPRNAAWGVQVLILVSQLERCFFRFLKRVIDDVFYGPPQFLVQQHNGCAGCVLWQIVCRTKRFRLRTTMNKTALRKDFLLAVLYGDFGRLIREVNHPICPAVIS